MSPNLLVGVLALSWKCSGPFVSSCARVAKLRRSLLLRSFCFAATLLPFPSLPLPFSPLPAMETDEPKFVQVVHERERMRSMDGDG